MIPFFRKLRKQLANDNKPLKYLRYAIGEIVLVVLGILIALQINSWNANRLDRKKEQVYLVKLSQELKVQLLYYKDLNQQFIKKEKDVSRIVNIWESNNPKLQDSIQYVSDLYATSIIDYWHKKPVVWSQFLESGDLSIIRNTELTEGLYTFYDRMEKIAENYESGALPTIIKMREIGAIIYGDINIDTVMENWDKAVAGNRIKYPDAFFNRVWDMRAQLIPPCRFIVSASHGQQLRIKPILQYGEELLKKLETAQSNSSENEPLKSN